jgi:fused signal recognition particle receptor
MGFFDKLKKGLAKTRESFAGKIEQVVMGYANIDDDLLDNLEEALIMADVGVRTSQLLMEKVRKGIKKKEIKIPADLKPFLEAEISELLKKGIDESHMAVDGPTVVLVIGVNGAGKTTTIGKLSAYYKEQGKSVMLAAADTFRAAAIDQLEIWGQRVGVPVIKHEEGSDPAAVAFDAVKAAKARGVDMLIIDTAGRLQTKQNLMEELKKLIVLFSGKYREHHMRHYLFLMRRQDRMRLARQIFLQKLHPFQGLYLQNLMARQREEWLLVLKQNCLCR